LDVEIDIDSKVGEFEVVVDVDVLISIGPLNVD
jgi:hypothetical protein